MALPLDVDACAVDGIWWRHIVPGGDIWYWPDPPPDARWQRGEVVGAYYLADSAETAWAEWYRSLAELGIPPAQALPRDLWRIGVSLERVADLSTEARLARVGLRPRRREVEPLLVPPGIAHLSLRRCQRSRRDQLFHFVDGLRQVATVDDPGDEIAAFILFAFGDRAKQNQIVADAHPQPRRMALKRLDVEVRCVLAEGLECLADALPIRPCTHAPQIALRA